MLASSDGSAIVPLLTEIESGLPCAASRQLGKGEVTVLGCDYPADLRFYRQLIESMNVSPLYRLNADGPGVVLIPTRSAATGKQLLHVINVAPHPVALTLRKNGKKMLGGKLLVVPARSGLVLPGALRVRRPSGKAAKVR